MQEKVLLYHTPNQSSPPTTSFVLYQLLSKHFIFYIKQARNSTNSFYSFHKEISFLGHHPSHILIEIWAYEEIYS